MNKREEKLLQNLKNLKFKLERRRERFVFLQQEIDRKAEEGSANATDYSKSSMYWHKQRRLEDRIGFIDDKIYGIEIKQKQNDWVANLKETLDSVFNIRG